MKVAGEFFAPLLSGSRKSIPFREEQLEDFTALPWGSIVTIEREGDHATGALLAGPPKFATSKITEGHWYLPVIETPNPAASRESLLKLSATWRTARGLDLRKSR